MNRIGAQAMPRYRLYREHKFVSIQVSDLERFIAKVDFTDFKQIAEVKNKLGGIIELMENHAKHEEERIHPLLKKKSSELIKTIEVEHQGHKILFEDLNRRLAEIEATNQKTDGTEAKERLIALGYEFYLAYRNFVAINLTHINEEENLIMPEIQKYYTDKEIKEAVDFPVYESISADDMVDMMSVLFPTMNIDDKEAFLRDLDESQSEKFLEAWPKIALTLDEKEMSQLIEKLGRKKYGI
ncbi:MAG TPA: hemerythrin domain-containing protein [Gammaproteobacteria bacterium]|nr:hemerythrin domain-containing protein [Gammaproteobacteria bacterium]